MSGDLDIYLTRMADAGVLRALVTSVATLSVSDPSVETWAVTHGPSGRHCFTMELPVRVELEDVPDEVAARMFEAAARLSISVDGAKPADARLAHRVARDIAVRYDGVVLDTVTGETWSEKIRTAARPAADAAIVSTVEFTWLVPGSSVAPRLVELWLDLCARYVREALPRRYGEYEPLQGRWDEGGRSQFLHEWEFSRTTVFLKGASPVEGGHVPCSRNVDASTQEVQRSFGLTVLSTAFTDPRWTHALRRLFVEFARRSESVYAYGEVVRGWSWSRGRLGYDWDTTEDAIPPGLPDQWLGLVPYPVFWAWYGPVYAPLVQGRLASGTIDEIGDGILHQLADAPADRDALERQISSTGGEWVREDLRLTVLDHDGSLLPIPTARAERIPEPLMRNPYRED